MSLALKHCSSAVVPIPWLAVPHGEDAKKLSLVNVFSPQKNLHKIFNETHGRKYVASMHGWVVMLDSRPPQVQCYLCALDTLETIDLPSLDADEDGVWTLTSPPSNPDCVVLFMAQSFFRFWQLGDQNWTTRDYGIMKNGVIQDDDYITNAIGYTNGYIYGVTRKMNIVKIEKNGSILPVRLLNFFGPPKMETRNIVPYLVESCGEIFLIATYTVDFQDDSAISHVRIFKMVFPEQVLVMVESLGDRIFFLSSCGSISFSATLLGTRGNCICILFGKDLYVFDQEDESLAVYFPCTELEGPSFSPFWFLPRDHGSRGNRENENAFTKEEDTTKTTDNCKLMDLPIDILQLIGKNLLPVGDDYMSYRRACKALKSSLPAITLSKLYPSLMFSNRRKSRWSFSDPNKNVTFCYDNPKLLDATIKCANYGWLLMSKGYTSLFLFNPFTNDTIERPGLPIMFIPLCIFNGFSFSCSPLYWDCVIFGIASLQNSSVLVAFAQRGEFTWQWQCHYKQVYHAETFRPCKNTSPAFLDGSFYCPGGETGIGIYHVRDRRWTVIPNPQPGYAIRQNYLVVCERKLTLVLVGIGGKHVDAYRLDRSNMTWHSVTSLKNQTLFICRTSALSVKATSDEMKNKIYFPISVNNYLFYSLETRRWHSSTLDFCREDLYNASEKLHCTWIQPTFVPASPSTVKERIPKSAKKKLRRRRSRDMKNNARLRN